MTTDAAHTERATQVAEQLNDLIIGAEYVLFDFDGPVCRLFAGHRAHEVAAGLVDRLEKHGSHVLLSDEERASGDPYAVLRAVHRLQPGNDLVEALEAELTREELHATATALPTPYADPLIRTWSAVGVGLAITGANSPQAMEEYLAGRGLRECFAPHIHGRTSDPHLVKPAPDCVRRALASLRADPAASLVIGDTPADLYAAREAGVPFLGYGREAQRAERLRRAGATVVVESLEPVLEAVRRVGRPLRQDPSRDSG
ncbi:HAD family hydrolase [Streptomyces sp. NPDC057445]|uniref:HAD family hydrolase n=1 Tax=Streptomyces sp. NPDC057445 TaxID=3346136 RepID=UPI0036B74E86